MKGDKFLNLKAKQKVKFRFAQNYSYISIRRIAVVGLKQNDWFNDFYLRNPRLIIKSSKLSGATKEITIPLNSFLNPNQTQPILDFNDNFIIPEENRVFKTLMVQYSNSATIEFLEDGDQTLTLHMIIYMTPETTQDDEI